MQIRMLREIDAMFEGAPQSRKTLEVKEEMLQNLMEKYNDLLSQGKSEEAAFNIAIGSVGDISDLLDELKQPIPKVASFPEPDMSGYDSYAGEPAPDDARYSRHSNAMLVSVAVMMYILSPVAVILFGGKFGLLMLFAMVAGATGLLIYNGMTTDKTKKAPISDNSETAYDNPPERPVQYSGKMSKPQKKFFASVTSALWLVTVALYFVISFYTGAWHITWIIFLIAAAANNVLKAYMDMSGSR